MSCKGLRACVSATLPADDQSELAEYGNVICFSDTEMNLVHDWCDEGETGAALDAFTSG
jgi:hypothetical protein